MSKKIVLHHCCVECTPKVLEFLSKNFEVVSVWYNPNIHPREEQVKRLEALKNFLKNNLIVNDEYIEPENWKKMISLYNKRCEFCYEIRLKKIADICISNDIDIFTTTLLVSPYQRHELIREIGEKIAKENGLNFFYQDFRQYFYDGKKIVKNLKLYIQKYCGCIISKEGKRKNENTDSR